MLIRVEPGAEKTSVLEVRKWSFIFRMTSDESKRRSERKAEAKKRSDDGRPVI